MHEVVSRTGLGVCVAGHRAFELHATVARAALDSGSESVADGGGGGCWEASPFDGELVSAVALIVRDAAACCVEVC